LQQSANAKNSTNKLGGKKLGGSAVDLKAAALAYYGSINGNCTNGSGSNKK